MKKIILIVCLLVLFSGQCFGALVLKGTKYIDSSGRCFGVLAKVYDTELNIYIYVDLSAGGVAIYDPKGAKK